MNSFSMRFAGVLCVTPEAGKCSVPESLIATLPDCRPEAIEDHLRHYG